MDHGQSMDTCGETGTRGAVTTRQRRGQHPRLPTPCVRWRHGSFFGKNEPIRHVHRTGRHGALHTDEREGGGTGRTTVSHLNSLGYGADAAASGAKPVSPLSHAATMPNVLFH